MASSVVWFDPEYSRNIQPDPAALGAKGANLVAMSQLGLPVPPGFILGTDTANKFREKGRLTKGIVEGVREALSWLEESTGRQFGRRRRPLLLAVRSGAPVSMPGMMDTILNVGLNDETVAGLERFSGNPRFAWDSYRRLITMYGDTVLGVPRSAAEEVLAQFREEQGVRYDWELDAGALQKLSRVLRNNLTQACGSEFPQDPEGQLLTAIEAVFSSWNSERCRAYREIHGLEDTGTAVTVQVMVFGNSGGHSGSGVAFSRDPSTGENRLYSEFLYNAQGEDVVSGARSPDPGDSLQANDPELYRQLRTVCLELEQHFRDMQDVEFTVEDGRLHLLQARTAKRSPLAALQVAVDMVEEELITPTEAVERLRGLSPEQLRIRHLTPPAGVSPIARGTTASVGVAVGEVALSASSAVSLRESGKRPILVRDETRAEDVRGMEASAGLLTARGGKTSHAAVVARQLGVCCIVGCEALQFRSDGGVTLAGTPLREGEPLSLDGHSGLVYNVEVPLSSPCECPELEHVCAWARELKLEPPFASTSKEERSSAP